MVVIVKGERYYEIPFDISVWRERERGPILFDDEEKILVVKNFLNLDLRGYFSLSHLIL